MTEARIREYMETFDVEQRSDAWRKLRLGIPTASMFGDIVTGGTGLVRSRALRVLAGEILSGEPSEGFRNGAMERGVQMEPDALDYYERTHFCDLTRVGFVKRTIETIGEPLVVGASPDALISEKGLLEVKTMRPDLLIAIAEKGPKGFPSEHRAQVQGSLWVTGREYGILMIYYRGMPIAPKFTVERDEVYINELRDRVEEFTYDLRKLVERLRGMAR